MPLTAVHAVQIFRQVRVCRTGRFKHGGLVRERVPRRSSETTRYRRGRMAAIYMIFYNRQRLDTVFRRVCLLYPRLKIIDT
mmetsp:Transcript_23595/g.46915  ORF Transcript_23595/g.46915 Transcript_23595/m.46915 type:complete len:81 (+) Transcript_23595:776-1018(+)